MTAAVGAAQQKPSPRSAVKPGIVSGRVFAITKGGDLKPARMAKVYLFYVERGGLRAAPREGQDTAGFAWMDSLSKGLEENSKSSEEQNKVAAELNKERQATQAAEDRALAQGDLDLSIRLGQVDSDLGAKMRANLASDSSDCRKGLMAYRKSLADTLKWASQKEEWSEDRTWQVVLADTDEDGVFKIAVARPGVYILLAHGQAGFNDAFWVTDSFTVNLGAETVLKLSIPEKACLVDGQ
jgi:hypothetical protein